jgi:hypothetical protein
MNRLPFLLKSVAMTALLWAAPSTAWDGIKNGKITGVDVTNAQNFGFRIYMDGTPMCGTTEGWAYVNKDWDNYDALVSLLTSAYLAGKTVIVHTTKVGSYCEIGYAAFR